MDDLLPGKSRIPFYEANLFLCWQNGLIQLFPESKFLFFFFQLKIEFWLQLLEKRQRSIFQNLSLAECAAKLQDRLDHRLVPFQANGVHVLPVKRNHGLCCCSHGELKRFGARCFLLSGRTKSLPGKFRDEALARIQQRSMKDQTREAGVISHSSPEKSGVARSLAGLSGSSL